MLKKASLILLSVFTVLIVGCTSTPTPKGIIYTGCKGPFLGTSNEGGSKVGKASASSLLGLFAWGDASINTAARSAGITKIHHVDYDDFLILFGLYSQYTVTVYGE